MTLRPRILFVAEAVTLAQVVRLVTLARSLDPSAYEIHFAASSFPDFIFGDSGFTQHPVQSISERALTRSLERGTRPYSRRTLSRYVEQELALLERIEPALVVGDFRLSLPISTRKLGLPFAALINAYFSPYAERDTIPVPDHPIVTLLGERLAARYFPQAIPYAFAHFAKPVNQLRRRYGLPEIGSLLEVLTDGDWTLYADPKGLIPMRSPLPEHHRLLGYVPWSPTMPTPDWWEGVDRTQPAVYVTLGSSGRRGLLPLVIEALAPLPIQLLVSTAGRAPPDASPPNVHVSGYLPGARAAERARFVVTNGGSSTGYQALAAGVPILGIPFNLDQHLASQALERAGVGLHVPARRASIEALRAAAQRLLSEESFTQGATIWSARIAAESSEESFRGFVRGALAHLARPGPGAARRDGSTRHL